MNSARIVVLLIALGAGGVAAYPASGSDDSSKPQPVAPVAQLPTFEILVARSEIGLGQLVKPHRSLRHTQPDDVTEVTKRNPP